MAVLYTKESAMDLLEDSGDETSNNTKMDGEVDENMLLNSDDEEVIIVF